MKVKYSKLAKADLLRLQNSTDADLSAAAVALERLLIEVGNADNTTQSKICAGGDIDVFKGLTLNADHYATVSRETGYTVYRLKFKAEKKKHTADHDIIKKLQELRIATGITAKGSLGILAIFVKEAGEKGNEIYDQYCNKGRIEQSCVELGLYRRQNRAQRWRR